MERKSREARSRDDAIHVTNRQTIIIIIIITTTTTTVHTRKRNRTTNKSTTIVCLFLGELKNSFSERLM